MVRFPTKKPFDLRRFIICKTQRTVDVRLHAPETSGS